MSPDEQQRGALSPADEGDVVSIEPMRGEDLDAVVALESVASNPAWSRAMFESELTTNQFAGFLVARAVEVGVHAERAMQVPPLPPHPEPPGFSDRPPVPPGFQEARAEGAVGIQPPHRLGGTHRLDAPFSSQRTPSNLPDGRQAPPTRPTTLAAPLAAIPRVVCGYIGFWIVFEELHVLNVAVHPDWRRRGVATRLVRTVFESAIAKGVTRGLLEVRASNLPAQRLYTRFGFQVIARRSGYYTQPMEDALIMACDGLGGAPHINERRGSHGSDGRSVH